MKKILRMFLVFFFEVIVNWFILFSLDIDCMFYSFDFYIYVYWMSEWGNCFIREVFCRYVILKWKYIYLLIWWKCKIENKIWYWNYSI